MRLPDFQYILPKSIQEASLFLKDHGRETKVMGGGTDLLPSMKQRTFTPKYVLHMEAISDLDRIEFDEKLGLRIGAMVKLHSLEKDSLILERYPIIRQAVSEVGSVQLRQMGTVGGNLSLDTRCYYYNQSDFWRKCRPKCIKMGGEICNATRGGTKCFAIFSGDLATALIALGAKIKLISYQGERNLLLKEYFTGNGARPLALDPKELLVSVEVPHIPKEVFTFYLKYRIRRSIDFPIANVAAMLILDGKEGVCREARIVIGAVGPKPEEAEEIRELLKGRRLESNIIEEASDLAFKIAKPVPNAASSPSYRKKMIKFFVKKILKQVLEKYTLGSN